jgi:hypothetical protein
MKPKARAFATEDTEHTEKIKPPKKETKYDSLFFLCDLCVLCG